MISRVFTRVAVLALSMVALPAPSFADTPSHKEWNFDVTLDGEHFGSHIFTLDKNTNHQWKVSSQADYSYKLIDIPVFHYHHSANAQWGNGCLTWLVTDTDHDGEIIHVTAQAAPNGGTVRVADKTETQTSWQGCLMDFAYWNPHMREQKRLLNPETGEIESVVITQEADKNIMVHGQQTAAYVWRITGAHEPIDVLYDHDGNWIGLDATVKGGHALSYRLP